MDEEFKGEWVVALRSGEYPQTTKALTRLDGEGNIVGCCCLGVACEIGVKKGILKAVDSGKESPINGSGFLRGYVPANVDTKFSLQPDYSVLPYDLQIYTGLMHHHGIARIPTRVNDDNFHLSMSLAVINDSGESFDHIADLIEYFG